MLCIKHAKALQQAYLSTTWYCMKGRYYEKIDYTVVCFLFRP